MGAKAGGKIDSVLFVSVCVSAQFWKTQGSPGQIHIESRPSRPAGWRPEPKRGPAWGLGRMLTCTSVGIDTEKPGPAGARERARARAHARAHSKPPRSSSDRGDRTPFSELERITLTMEYALPGHAERSEAVVPKASVGAPLDLKDERSNGGHPPSWYHY